MAAAHLDCRDRSLDGMGHHHPDGHLPIVRRTGRVHRTCAGVETDLTINPGAQLTFEDSDIQTHGCGWRTPYRIRKEHLADVIGRGLAAVVHHAEP